MAECPRASRNPPGELRNGEADELESSSRHGLRIEQWSAEDVGCDLSRIGGRGSPTNVKKIERVQLVSSERVQVEPTKEGLAALVRGLIADHILE